MTREEAEQKVTYCRCGRAMTVMRQDGDGFEKVCPKFNRSWRNLWFGGLTHQGRHYFPFRLKTLEGQWGSLDLMWR